MNYKTLTKMVDGDYSVELQLDDTGRKYRVVYGGQVYNCLTWKHAAEEYGYCVFHSLECAGIIDRVD